MARAVTDPPGNLARPTRGSRPATGQGVCAAPLTHETARELRAFCERLRALRLASGLSLAQAAERMGIDAPALCRLENGRNPNPTIETLGRYAAALGHTVTLGLREASPQ